MTVLVMGAALLIGVVLNYVIPENVFLLIASIATFATVWVWLMILMSQVAMRRSMTREQIAELKFPVPFWPYGPAMAIAFMLFIFGVLGYFPDTQAALIVGVIWWCSRWPPTCCGASHGQGRANGFASRPSCTASHGERL